MAAHEGEQHLIAAAHHVLKALVTAKNLSDEMRKLVADLDVHLTIMTKSPETKIKGFTEIEDRLNHAKARILCWQSNQTMIWDTGTEELSEYLTAVVDIQTMMESFRNLSVNENRKLSELFLQADGLLEIAMPRLAEEIIHILNKHKQHIKPEHVSFRSTQREVNYDDSFVSNEDESVIEEETSQRFSSRSVSAVCTVDLVDTDVIPHVKAIADVFFASQYGWEFCESFTGVRSDALYEYLVTLDMEKFSIEEMLEMEWTTLSREIRKWNSAMKIIIQVYLASEKQLCDKILGHFGSVNSFCFLEIAKPSLRYLLNFGEAVAIGPVRPDKLFRLLDMFEVLQELLLDVDELFSEDAGSYFKNEFQELRKRIGHSARATLSELQHCIVSNASRKALPRGGVHPLTRYTMNYFKTLTIYSATLDLLLKDQNVNSSNPASSKLEDGEEDIVSTATFCPLAQYLRLVTSALEDNLVEKSKLYKEKSLQHIFLMNNIHYIVDKVKNSDLRSLFGDEWIREHKGKCQQHTTSYERATWVPVLSLLGVDATVSTSLFKPSANERCRRFNIAFEEVYKSQTEWCIPDAQLQDDVQISSSVKVIAAYRTFLGRFSKNICKKNIKYTVEDLENLLLDFFQGSRRSLQNSIQR